MLTTGLSLNKDIYNIICTVQKKASTLSQIHKKLQNINHKSLKTGKYYKYTVIF